ncbi:MAG: hypothetical protein AAFN93_14225 [Bacteroidota bacterium]
MNEGGFWEMTSYNAKGKTQGSSKYQVKSLDQSGDDYTALIQIQILDQKDKEVMDNELKFKCEDGVLHYDMSQLMPAKSMQAYKDMDLQMTGDNLEYPSNLSVGDKLKDATMNIAIIGEGLPFDMNFKIETKDRKVMSKETITTPAGTFDCFKISMTTVSKTVGSVESKSIEYIAPGKGIVRTETYNRGGKMTSYSELTAFSE